MSKREQKYAYWQKLWNLIETHEKIMIINADNVGSKQIQDCRKALRGKATMLMGKNTLVRAGITRRLKKPEEGDDDYELRKDSWYPLPEAERLLALCRGNVGFIFCKEDPSAVREVLNQHTKPAAARAGVLAPTDIIVPAGPTGLDPGMTSFFGALKIATKIVRNQIEILNDNTIVEEGKKIGNSEVALLNKLGIKPFEYGLVIEKIYDNGSVYDAKVLDLTDDDIVANFLSSSQNLAAISLQVGYPTAVSVPHSIVDAFKNLVALTLEGEYTIKQAEAFKEMIKNPSAFAVAATTTGGAGETKEAEPEKKEESEEAGDVGGLFGDDEEDY